MLGDLLESVERQRPKTFRSPASEATVLESSEICAQRSPLTAPHPRLHGIRIIFHREVA